MGNRAVITFGSEGSNAVGVYVHWNGGEASVKAFADTCLERGYRCPTSDPAYAMAGLIAVVQEFFGASGLSVGVGTLNNLDCDNFDNGVYRIGEGWRIIERWGKGSRPLTRGYFNGCDREQYEGVMTLLKREQTA